MVAQPNSLAGRDVATVIHPYTNLEQHKTVGPTVITRGEGVYVYDDSGKKYLEGMAGLWSTSLGFSEKRLVEAAKRDIEAETRRSLDQIRAEPKADDQPPAVSQRRPRSEQSTAILLVDAELAAYSIRIFLP